MTGGTLFAHCIPQYKGVLSRRGRFFPECIPGSKEALFFNLYISTKGGRDE